jgi:hypothetical protein
MTDKQLEAALIANGWRRENDENDECQTNYEFWHNGGQYQVLIWSNGKLKFFFPWGGVFFNEIKNCSIDQIAAIFNSLGIPFDPAAGSKETK